MTVSKPFDRSVTLIASSTISIVAEDDLLNCIDELRIVESGEDGRPLSRSAMIRILLYAAIGQLAGLEDGDPDQDTDETGLDRLASHRRRQA